MTTYSSESNRRKELQIPSGQVSGNGRQRNASGSSQLPANAPRRTPASKSSAPARKPSNGSSGKPPVKPPTGRPQQSGGGKKRKRPMTKKRKLKIAYIIIGIVLLLSIFTILAAKFIVPLYNAATGLGKDNSYSEDDIENNFEDESLAAHMNGFINIAVFGIDTRERNESTTEQINDDDSRSDVIMIISVNTETKEIKLLSVYRDTYLYSKTSKNGNMQFDKINHAYSNGKASNALNVLNRNLDLNITDYVTVDFSIVAQCIDAVGGIEIELEEKEIEKYNRDGSYRTTYPLLNHYIDEINELTDSNSPHIKEPGVYLMDGVQATAFARIRYCDTDFERTARQREVLMKLFEKAKTQGVTKLLEIAETVAPQVVTSLTWSEIIDLAKYALTCEIGEQQGFPFHQASGKISGSNTAYVFAEDLVADVSELHYYLFGQENYVPTSMVQNISDKIDNKRGSYTPSDSDSDSDNSYTSTTAPVTEAPTEKPDDDNTSTVSAVTAPPRATAVTRVTPTPYPTTEVDATEEPDEGDEYLDETEEPDITDEPEETEEPVATEKPTQEPVQTDSPGTVTE